MKGLGAGGRLWELIERKPELPFNGGFLFLYHFALVLSLTGYQAFDNRLVLLKTNTSFKILIKKLDSMEIFLGYCQVIWSGSAKVST